MAKSILDSAVLTPLKLAGGQDVQEEVDITKLTNPEKEHNEILAILAEYLGTHPFIENRVTRLISSSSALLSEPILP